MKSNAMLVLRLSMLAVLSYGLAHLATAAVPKDCPATGNTSCPNCVALGANYCCDTTNQVYKTCDAGTGNCVNRQGAYYCVGKEVMNSACVAAGCNGGTYTGNDCNSKGVVYFAGCP